MEERQLLRAHATQVDRACGSVQVEPVGVCGRLINIKCLDDAVLETAPLQGEMESTYTGEEFGDHEIRQLRELWL